MKVKFVDTAERQTGVIIDKDGTVKIRVWCPDAERVDLQTQESTIPLLREAFGYWTAKTNDVKAGDKYHFNLDGQTKLADPASVHQPDGVHGPSEIVSLDYAWTDDKWQPAPFRHWIIYELHTGTFTDGSDFEGISNKLDHLVELGINAIEIMPCAQFPGKRNWGYDGVFPFAVQNSYGGPKALQRLVDDCHARGIAVILDVVYNHFGPEGNYLTEFGPYFTDKYQTPWGSAINFDDACCDPVRAYFIENALMWFRDFHIDGLRLDAVHAIKDLSPKHILAEIREATADLSQQTGRTHRLIVELDLNDNRYIDPLEKRGYGMDGQWIDEFHHALRVTVGGSRTGYYSDFNGIMDLAKAYNDAYVYDGQYSEHRQRFFGVKATENPGEQFVVFSQNHDQVGNRMLGERSSVLHSEGLVKTMAAAVMLSPFLPMLFMGEEYGEEHPFLYFVDHSDPELSEAVRKGRKAEFAAFHTEGEAPDPTLREVFEQSKLSWDRISETKHQQYFSFYKELIALRKSYSCFLEPDRKGCTCSADQETQLLTLHRRSASEAAICFFNFSNETHAVSLPEGDWKLIFTSAAANGSENEILAPQSVAVYLHKYV